MTNTQPEQAILRAGVTWPDRLDAAARTHSTVGVATPLSAWRKAVDPDGAGLFERRLAWDGISPAAASRMLAHIEAPDSTDWLTELRHLRAALTRGTDPDPALEDLPFAPLLTPLVNDAWTRMVATCEAAWLQAWAPSTYATLRHDLGRRIAQVAAETWYSDFARGRPPGADVMARLGWSTDGDEAFRRWCEQQGADGMGLILHEHPVLGRLLGLVTGNWAASIVTMLRRVHHHRQDLEGTFGVATDELVTGVEPGLSDPHRGAQTVAIVEFGSGVRIVYKPKDLRVEHRFQHLIHRINTWFGDVPIQEITVLPAHGDYGFTSTVDHRPCPEAQLPDFYRAAGRLLTVLFLLGATDAHAENVIATGSSLALIDAETLFHIDIGKHSPPWGDTVLRTGMLPAWTPAGPEAQLGDLSALGVHAAGTAEFVGWTRINTDGMARVRRTGPMPVPLSCPVEPPRHNPLAAHVEPLVRGLRDVYQAASDRRFTDLLLSAVKQFSGLPQRAVLRSTRVYATVAMNATSARATTSPNARGFALESLARAALVSGQREPMWQVYRAELQEMENLDIPFFTHVLGDTDVQGRLGPIYGLVRDNPLTDATERIGRMGADDLAWQERLVRGAIRARFADFEQPTADRTTAVRTGLRAEPDAAAVLSDIARAAIARPDEAPTWLALFRLPDGEKVRLGMIGDGWYDGRAGVGAVQWWAGDMWNDAGLAAHAASTMQPLSEVLEHPDYYMRKRFVRDLGLGFAGWGGLLRSLMLTDDVTTRDALLSAASMDLVARDRHLDLIGGAAGIIGPLASLTDNLFAHALLVAAAHRLATTQLPSGGWPSTMSKQPMTGFAHGAAGMGLALVQAGTALGREEWIDAGVLGFEYEHSVFDSQTGTWPDFRNPGRPPMVAWCHGAAGIGLSRVRALDLLPDHPDAPRWHEELSVAMQATAGAPPPVTDHLCCGLTGRAAVLSIAGRAMSEQSWISASDGLTQAALEGFQRRGRFALPLDDPTDPATVSPGLMTGLAGIAAHLLAREQDEDLAAFLL